MKAALLVLSALAAANARADAVTDWNLKSAEFITESKLGTPPAMRVMAIVQTAAAEAVDGALQRGASPEAALAAAHRAAFTRLLPAQQAAIEAAAQAAIAAVPDGPGKQAGIAAGEAAAARVLAARAADSVAGESYRPHAVPGAYVPTAAVAAPQWSQRKPWLMASAAQFRPAAPPALTSAQWARDYDEVKSLGGKASTQRSAAQTEAARFWEYSLPSIYHGVLRSVALQPGRDLARNARLFAAAAQAMDDALISVFDAKYHHHFWRPVTAIRNGDIDGHDATQRDASWMPLIDAPMHPEYPSGHAVLVGALAAVIEGESRGGPLPVLATTSPSAKGAERRWQRVDDLVREVSDARVHAGIHFRSAVDVGVAMGRQVGALAVERALAPQP